MVSAKVKANKESVDMFKKLKDLEVSDTGELYGFKTTADAELASILVAELTQDAQEMGMYCTFANVEVPTTSVYGKKCLGRVKLSTLEGDLSLLVLSLEEKSWKVSDFEEVCNLLLLLAEASIKLSKLKATNE